MNPQIVMSLNTALKCDNAPQGSHVMVRTLNNVRDMSIIIQFKL